MFDQPYMLFLQEEAETKREKQCVKLNEHWTGTPEWLVQALSAMWYPEPISSTLMFSELNRINIILKFKPRLIFSIKGLKRKSFETI